MSLPFRGLMAVDDVLALYNSTAQPVSFGKIQKKQITDRLTQLKNIVKVFHTGLNTGHHAEAFLKHSKDLKWFVSCDDTRQAHTEKVADYLSCLFPDKFCFLKGSAHIVIPLHAKVIEEIKFDLIFIDGQKACDEIVSEIIQSKLIAHQNTRLWINNYHTAHVQKACDILMAMEQIEMIQRHDSVDTNKKLTWVEANFKDQGSL